MAHTPFFAHLHIQDDEYADFVDFYLRAYAAAAEVFVMESLTDIYPLISEIDLTFKEATTRTYEHHHVKAMGLLVLSVKIDFVQVETKQIRC